ncbi:MAG: efflux transporter periplasmic adaptor subunit [Hydrocarboniphaga sp.]|uniref:efflux RND transporter periplasmic adaptor subunit n=1 Tax=Hydrocarboniphaga sp. TaxID=2033016 RepID=UPI00262B3CB8|nr:efflux RND transporter periplasmic adaptor subunit [Hydrocarboniphaga sp.]MDB5969141.1 efflux transporter periplasmic adaptor subunit [Hydrocarboniphaga sp.]
MSAPVLKIRSAVGRFGLPLVLVFALAACHKAAAPSAAANPVMAVQVVAPQTGDWPQAIGANGNVQAWQEAVIGSEVSGTRLLEVMVNVGDIVRKGQVLATLDPAMMNAELAQQEAAVAQAEASLAKALADAQRAGQLDQTGSISQQDIQQYRTAAATAEAQLKLARAQRDAASVQLRRTRVLSPDDGVISSRSATVGTVAGSGTELFRLIRDRRLEWRAEVPAEQLSRVRPGMTADVQRPDGSVVTGTVRQLAPGVDTKTRNGIVYVDLPRDCGLAAGEFVGGSFVLGSSSALFVPESSIVLRDGNRYVMKLDANNHVHETKVTTLRRHGEDIEIGSALTAADRVVKAGGSFVGEGDLVSVAAGNAASKPSAR